ncbi:aerolysin-like protein [Haliotis asinina]|uniref:aerolysin-like protein n=1 Tax=Haliotis asinina TaxID=109174 RepID=UPI003531CBBD
MGANSSKSPVVDLEEVLKTYAWNAFVKTDTYKEKGTLRLSDVDIDIVWNRVHFSTSEPAFGSKQGPFPVESQIVFKAHYNNKTSEFQEQNFSTSRTTVAKATTLLTRGFTRGIHTDIKISVPPEVAYATSGFGNTVSIKTDEVNTVEHTLTWTTNSNIRLPPKSKMLAQLQVSAQQFQCDFSAYVTFKGTAVLPIKDRTTQALLRTVQNDICTIVKDELKRRNIKYNTSNPEAITLNGKTVQWPISGELRFKYGITQDVLLDPVEGSTYN